MYTGLTKLVVWPRKQEGKHVYVVVGAIACDQPIPSLEGNEFLVYGQHGVTSALAHALDAAPKASELNMRLGDANDVLLSLKDILPGVASPED